MKNLLLIVIAVLLVACQDDNFETPSYNQEIVVDGWIEQGQPARVFLTLSAPYFSEVDSVSLRKLVLKWAKVTVSDGINQEILMLKTNQDYFPPYVYESSALRGVVGRTYSLKVEYGGRTVTSTTRIPEMQQLDSIWFKPELGVDTAGYIKIIFTDKPGIDNFYRIMTKIGSKTKKYTPVFLPNLDGRLVDGQSVELSISGEKELRPLLFNVNDTVYLKFCSIDKPVFNFWSSLYAELQNAQNPFAATSTNVKSNVNGGLGIWAGYGVNGYRIICK